MSFNDGLMDGGAPSFKFEKRGDTVEGVIDSVEKKQQTEYKTKRPLVWRDGTPRWQWDFTLVTSLRDSDEDDGHRRIYAKGELLKAIRQAIRDSKHRGDVVGGTLKVQHTGTRPSEAGNDAKLFRARFTPPVVTASSFDDGDPGDEASNGGGNDDDIPF